MPRPVIRLLGTLAVERDGEVLGPRDFRGLKPKQILEILVLADGHPVSKDRLADLLWPDERPRNVQATIETYVSVLRGVLGRELGRQLIRTAAEAYVLDRAQAQVDQDRFEELVARAAGRQGAQRRVILEDALALVRGELLEDEPYAPWVETARDQQRLRTREVRLDAGLAALVTGDHRGVLDHARTVLDGDPLDEGAARLAMLGYEGAGARRDALAVFERCRTALAEELGVDPDPSTEAIHLGILRNQPRAELLRTLDGVAATAASPATTTALRTRAMRVLLVEDDPADAHLIGEALGAGSVPTEVDHVWDGEAAIAHVHGEADRPDLILLDVGLPGRSGIEVLGELKQDPRSRRIPVVMLTSSAAEGDVARSYDLHANGYVTKPIDLDDLADVVRALESFWPLTAKAMPEPPS